MTTIYDVLGYLNIGVIVSIAIFIITQVILFLSKKKESKERLSRVCNSLKIEIDNLLDWYESEEYRAFKSQHHIIEYNEKEKKFEQKNEYVQNILNTVPYNGIVNSGSITYLQKETQDKLNEFYAYATLHNKRMFDLAQIYNDKASSSDFNLTDIDILTSSLAWGINESELILYEGKMKDMRRKLKDLLEKEIEDAEQSIFRKFFRLKHTYKS